MRARATAAGVVGSGWGVPAAAGNPESTRAGVTMTAAERKVMVLTDDLGGQYWARDNTGFVPFTAGDPVAPASTTTSN